MQCRKYSKQDDIDIIVHRIDNIPVVPKIESSLCYLLSGGEAQPVGEWRKQPQLSAQSRLVRSLDWEVKVAAGVTRLLGLPSVQCHEIIRMYGIMDAKHRL